MNAQGSYACCCEQGYTWNGSDCVGRFAVHPAFCVLKLRLQVAEKVVLLYLQWKTLAHQIHVMKMVVVMMQWVFSLVIVTLDTLGMD